jgi:hypothetical protein
MHLSWLGLVLKAALGSAPDAPLESVGQSGVTWNVISDSIILVGAVLSVIATLITLVGLRPTRQTAR